jgi:TPR repeat protein
MCSVEWGDPDALSEAGFCYANGVGAKKDMKKAAKFYRMAEKKGVSMVGNSWIWKDKYLDEEDKAVKMSKQGGGGGGGGKREKEKEKEGGRKEGGIWGRKKSTA